MDESLLLVRDPVRLLKQKSFLIRLVEPRLVPVSH